MANVENIAFNNARRNGKGDISRPTIPFDRKGILINDLARVRLKRRYHPLSDVCVGARLHICTCVAMYVLLCLANFANSAMSSLHESYVNELVLEPSETISPRLELYY